MKIRRGETTDEEALAGIRRSAIFGLAVPAISMEQAVQWATRSAADRIVRAIRDHDVWVAVEETMIGWVEIDRDRIAALYVSPPWSRRGVGSGLLARAETTNPRRRLRDCASPVQPERPRFLPPQGLPAMWPIRCRWGMSVEQRAGCSWGE